jgi:hypothetical protein
MVRAKEPRPERRLGDQGSKNTVQSDSGGDAPPRNVNMQAGGAKRMSYFKNRDYKP